ncbi:MAG: hypothetical protein WCG84_01420 [Candidatus Moraniibacteriota bacterium]
MKISYLGLINLLDEFIDKFVHFIEMRESQPKSEGIGLSKLELMFDSEFLKLLESDEDEDERDYFDF